MKLRRVVGDSMKPALFAGDIVVIKKSNNIQKGDIVMASHNGREIIKRVQKITKKRVTLVGDNKKASTDSRTFGSLPRKDITGVAVFALGTSRFAAPALSRRKRAVIAAGSVLAITIFSLFAFHGFDTKRIAQLANTGPVATPAVAKKIEPNYTVDSVKKDVPYCNGQALDVYYPRKAVYENAPVVMYMHGGGWQINDKASEPNQLAVLDPMRDKGFAVVSIDYRKLPDNFFPAPVSDALCSVRFLHAEQKSLGIDAEKIGIYGFSAGGHLAAMVGLLDSQNAFNEGPYKEQSSRVKAVATLAGIFSFEQATRYNNDLKIRYFMNGAEKVLGQPVSYVTKDDPPFFMVHGLQDQYVAPEQDDVLAGLLNNVGVKNEIMHVQNAEHGLGQVGGEPVPSVASAHKAIRDFLARTILE